MHPQAKGDILGDRPVREKGVVLEHQTEVALMSGGIGKVYAVPEDFTAFRFFQTGDNSQEGAFSAARRSQKANRLITGNFKVDIRRSGRPS